MTSGLFMKFMTDVRIIQILSVSFIACVSVLYILQEKQAEESQITGEED